MKEMKAFKYRAYPTKTQKKYIRETTHACWWFYRYVLHHLEDDYKTAKKNFQDHVLSYYAGNRAYHPFWYHAEIGKVKVPKEFYPLGAPLKRLGKGNLSTYKILQKARNARPYLKDLPAIVLQESLERVDRAFKAFWNTGAGYPNYPPEWNYRTITWPDSDACHLYEDRGLLKLMKFPGLLKLRYHRPIEGKIKRATITRDTLGQYYVSLICESSITTPPLPRPAINVIGIDIGIRMTDSKVERSYCTFSNGEKVLFPRTYPRYEIQEKRINHKMSGMKRGSQEWKKELRKLNHLRERQVNIKSYWIHQLTNRLNQEFDYVVIEEITLKKMKSKTTAPEELSNDELKMQRKVRKGFAETAHGEFKLQLAYKLGSRLISVNPANTSKQCSSCGFVNPAVKLEIAQWVCPECGASHDRDHNAAINILARGMEQIQAVNTGKV